MKESIGTKIFDYINLILLFLITIITIYPLYYVLMASFSDGDAVIKYTGPILLPIGFNIEAYKAVFLNPRIFNGYSITLLVLLIGISINILMTSLAAYCLSRKEFYIGKIVLTFMIFTMYFSGGLIPFYLTVKGLGLDNTIWALIFPVAKNTYNFIILRTGFTSVPSSLIESAKIDGANHLTILFRIVVPLARATLAVIILYYAVGHWNSWFNAMLFLRDKNLYPLQLILREILIQNDTNSMTIGIDLGDTGSLSETLKYATIIVSTLPILIVYPFLQKYFASGVMVGAVKG